MARLTCKLVHILGPVTAVLALSLTAACSTPASTEQKGTTVVPPAEDDGDELNSKGKSWGGWRWKGDRDNCYFIHENRCFAAKKAACKAAGCAEAACKTGRGAPAAVSCKDG